VSCLVIINCIEFQTGHYPYLQTNADTSQLFDCTIVCQEILKFSQTNIIYLKQCALSTIEPVKESFITVFLWNTSSLSQHILYLWNLTAVLAKISNVSSVWFFFLWPVWNSIQLIITRQLTGLEELSRMIFLVENSK
jgi:hypothetical protein